MQPAARELCGSAGRLRLARLLALTILLQLLSRALGLAARNMVCMCVYYLSISCSRMCYCSFAVQPAICAGSTRPHGGSRKMPYPECACCQIGHAIEPGQAEHFGKWNIMAHSCVSARRCEHRLCNSRQSSIPCPMPDGLRPISLLRLSLLRLLDLNFLGNSPLNSRILVRRLAVVTECRGRSGGRDAQVLKRMLVLQALLEH